MCLQGSRANSLKKCKLLDLSDDTVVVGEGCLQTQEAKALVNGLPLGPKAVKVFLDVVHEDITYLWRPTIDLAHLEDCLHSFISWPARKVVFDNPPEEKRHQSPTPNIVSSVGNGRETGSKVTFVATISAPTKESPATDHVFFFRIFQSSGYFNLCVLNCVHVYCKVSD